MDGSEKEKVDCKVMQVIMSNLTVVGRGTVNDPCRKVGQIIDLDGNLLAEDDTIINQRVVELRHVVCKSRESWLPGLEGRIPNYTLAEALAIAIKHYRENPQLPVKEGHESCSAQIDRLAKWFQENVPEWIKEGGAVDNAIRVLEEHLHEPAKKKED